LLVIGGGIVGLSTAMNALGRFPSLRVVVVEKEKEVAAHQTGHNSGVIHSGVYYKPGSLKAQLCVRGAAAMVAFCREHGLPHDVCGKVIVATRDEELPQLAEIERRAGLNRVPGVQRIGPERLREIEPHASGIAALHVASTGIADFASVAGKYAEIIAARGGQVRTGAGVIGIRRDGTGWIVETAAGEFRTRYLIACAGLFADRVARMTGTNPDVHIVGFRGEYYEIVPARQALVHALIYPVPDPRFPFLGVHFTRRARGGVEAGPNAVLALKREGYRKTDISLRDTAEALGFAGFRRMALRNWRYAIAEYRRSFSKRLFVRGLQRLVPEIRQEDLAPGGSGVRAQALERSGALVDDFRFAPAEGVINVLNVPSPAATASIVIGEAIVDLAQKTFSLDSQKG
jgi:L-2-hydroxyglutarate oxidase LhgO